MDGKHPWPRLRDLAQQRVESVCSTLGKMDWAAAGATVLNELCEEWPAWEAGYDPHWPSDITDDGSPFELSLELGSGHGDLSLRMLVEPVTTPRNGEGWALASWRAGLSVTERLRALGAHLDTYVAIRDLFRPLPSIPVRFAVWHACTLGTHGPHDFKVYLNPQVVGSEAAPMLVARAMHELGHAARFEALRAALSDRARPTYVSLDLLPHGAARTKVYYAHPGESTDAIAAQLERAGAPAAALRASMDALADGPTETLSRPIQTCFAFVPGAAVPEVNVYVPMRACVSDDATAVARLEPLIGPARRTLVESAAVAVGARALDAGRGIVTYAGLRKAANRERVVVYLSPQIYASQSVRNAAPERATRKAARRGAVHESGELELRSHDRPLPTSIGTLRTLVESERAHLARHPFFDALRKEASMVDVQRIAPRVAFFVMAFQDVLRLVTEKTHDARLRALARSHQLEDAGHDHWYLRDLEVLGITTSLSMLFARDARAIRDVSYHQIAEAIRTESDLARFAVVLCLEAAGVEFFSSMVDGLERLGRSEGLLYFSKKHQAVEASHEIFEDERRDAIDSIVVPVDEAPEVVRAVMRTFDTMRSLADDLDRVLGRGSSERRSA